MSSLSEELFPIGFNEFDMMIEGIRLLYKSENGMNYVVCVNDSDVSGIRDIEAVEGLKQNIAETLSHTSITTYEYLTIIIADDSASVRAIVTTISNCWLIDRTNRQLIIYENQPEDFANIKHIIEECVYGREQKAGKKAEIPKPKASDIFNFTNLLIVVNFIVYACTVMGAKGNVSIILYKSGALRPRNVIYGGEIYRMFTSMFLHVDASHILNNMLCLFVFGRILEKEWGKIKLLAVYLLGGLGGSLLYCASYRITGTDSMAVGASGSVYALFGAMIVLTVMLPELRKQVNGTTLLIVVFISLFQEIIFGQNIAIEGHVGGFITGAILAFFIQNIDNLIKENKEQNYIR